MKNNFMQRAITGIIFVAVLIGCILGGPVSFGILFAIISAAAINEFGNLINKQEDVQMNKRICILGGIFLFLCFFYYGINPAQTGIFGTNHLPNGKRAVSQEEKSVEQLGLRHVQPNLSCITVCLIKCIGIPF